MDRKSIKKYIGFLLAELGWGSLLALFLQHTRPGQYLANRRAWLAVVIGVAGTQAISLPVAGGRGVIVGTLAFAFSAIGIVARSLVNEQRLDRVLHDATHKT